MWIVKRALAAVGVVADASASTGDIKGSIAYTGTPPKLAPVKCARGLCDPTKLDAGACGVG